MWLTFFDLRSLLCCFLFDTWVSCGLLTGFFYILGVFLFYFCRFSLLFCFFVLRRNLSLGKVVFLLRNWTFFTELRGVNVFRILIFFSVRTEDVLFISKYNIQFSWCIYQSRIVIEIKKLTSKLLKRKMQHIKKYGLIADPRDLIKNNYRAYFSIVLEPADYYYGHWIETVAYYF